MSVRLLLPALLILALACACAPKTMRPTIDSKAVGEEAERQKELALKEIKRRQERLGIVSMRLLTANAPLCKSTRPAAGYGMVSAALAPDGWRDAYKRVHGCGDLPLVFMVTPGSAAEKAGLRPGDEIVALNGAGIATPDQARDFIRGGKDLAKKGSWTLTLTRNATRQDVTITPEPICDMDVSIMDSGEVNAFAASGDKIMVTRGMMDFATSDDDLALVVGHEMGHLSMEHLKAKMVNRIPGAILDGLLLALLRVNTAGAFAQATQGAFSQDFELEADYVGLYLTHRAGFSITEAADFWRKMAANHPKAITTGGGTHPTTPERYVGIDAARAEIERKCAEGGDVKPEMKK